MIDKSELLDLLDHEKEQEQEEQKQKNKFEELAKETIEKAKEIGDIQEFINVLTTLVKSSTFVKGF